MKTLLVGYDLNKPGQNYADLEAKIKSCGAWWHNLDSTWLIRANMTPVELREALKPYLDASDELLVIDVTADAAAWTGFSKQASQWILDHL
jgi:hypothetical protein